MVNMVGYFNPGVVISDPSMTVVDETQTNTKVTITFFVCSAFSGMMNGIYGKNYIMQNNIQHILTCKSIVNPKCYITSYDVAHLRQICMYAPPT